MVKPGKVWTDEEIELIVDDYLGMLQFDLAGEKFNKAEYNRVLQQAIGRSKGSIEYKHQNISAVMERMGLPSITGYKPPHKFQTRLYEVVDFRLSHTGLSEKISNDVGNAIAPAEGLRFLEAPERHPEPDTPDRTVRRIIRLYDPAKRDARLRKLGEAGEHFLYRAEKNRLSWHGRDDLANKVRWISKEDGDGAGYDILSFSRNGEKRLLEVKTTNGPVTTPFWISRNELQVSEENREIFRVARLYQFSRSPLAFRLKPPLEDHVNLRAAEYFATFR